MDGALLLRGRDYEYAVPGEWALARCRTCGFLYQSPFPAPEAIPSFYPNTYSAYTSDPATNLLFRGAYWFDARRIRKLIGLHGRILDIGCGDGSALVAMRAHGDWELWGLELDEQAAQRARRRGLKVQAGDLLTCDLPEASFDLIRMGHVIEHVLDPVATLERALRLLRPGGVLLGETPNVACWDFKLFGKYWGALHLPRHIVFFDHRNLRHALERVGFRDVLIEPRLRTVGWSAGIQNLLADRFGLKVPAHGRVRWYVLLILPFLPVTFLQSRLDWPATIAFTAKSPL